LVTEFSIILPLRFGPGRDFENQAEEAVLPGRNLDSIKAIYYGYLEFKSPVEETFHEKSEYERYPLSRKRALLG